MTRLQAFIVIIFVFLICSGISIAVFFSDNFPMMSAKLSIIFFFILVFCVSLWYILNCLIGRSRQLLVGQIYKISEYFKSEKGYYLFMEPSGNKNNVYFVKSITTIGGVECVPNIFKVVGKDAKTVYVKVI